MSSFPPNHTIQLIFPVLPSTKQAIVVSGVCGVSGLCGVGGCLWVHECVRVVGVCMGCVGVCVLWIYVGMGGVVYG